MSEITKSIQIICDEKGISADVVMEAVETALAAAFRKDFGSKIGNYKVKFDAETGDMKVWDVKTVVVDIDDETLEKNSEELSRRREAAAAENRELTVDETADLASFNPKTEIMLADAKEIKKDAAVGDVLEMEQEIPAAFGRMAAQTAKQVIIQKLREAERNIVFDEFKEHEGEIMQGIVPRRDRNGAVIVDFGRITGLLPLSDQIRRESYRPGQRIRAYVASVEQGPRGPQILLSRTDTRMVSHIFEQEIPEVGNGAVLTKGIARDAGNRSKVAVHAHDDSIDPIGACIGQRGGRITTIIDELGGEKIDIIQWNEDTKEFVRQALSPAKILSVELNDETKEATVRVASDQFSLAIGRGGVNVRLAAQLTGYTIHAVESGDEEKKISSTDDEVVVEQTLAPAEAVAAPHDAEHEKAVKEDV